MNRPDRWHHDEDGAIPFVLVGVAALGGVLGTAWVGHEWSQRLLGEAGGELTVWVLRGAFWALDLVALQASMEPVDADWYTPVLEGPALPIYALAALVMVGTPLAETIAGMVQGNTTRIVQAVFRALVAGMLATVGASLLLAVGGGLSEIGRIALQASGTSVDAPLVPLQEVLMDAAEQRGDGGVELFIAFLAGLVIVLTCLSIYFLLAMRPVVLAAIIVFLPIAHAVSVWTPLRRLQLRVWSLAFAVLLADAAILTDVFAVADTAMGQPEGVDRLIFGTFGLLLAALSPAALARIVGVPELHSAVQTMSRGSKALAIGAGLAAVKGGQRSLGHAVAAAGRTGGAGGSSALEAAGPAAGGGSAPGGPGGGPGGGSGSSGGGPPSSPAVPGGGGISSAVGIGNAGRGGAGGTSGSAAGTPASNGRGSAPAGMPATGTANGGPGPSGAPAGAAPSAGSTGGSAGASPPTSPAGALTSAGRADRRPAAGPPSERVVTSVGGPSANDTGRVAHTGAGPAPAGRSGWSCALAEAGRR